MLIFAHNLRTN